MKKTILTSAMAAVCVAAAACHDPQKFILSDAVADKFLSVTPSISSIAADGISRVTLTAQIDPATDTASRTVAFSTTLGMFVGAGGQRAPTVNVIADATGKATTQLESVTTAGQASVTVKAGAVTRTTLIDFVAILPEDAFTVQIDSRVLQADGFSRTRVVVTLKRVGEEAQRKVTFESRLGTILAPGQAAKASQDVTADSSGVAAVELQAGKTRGSDELVVTALGVQQKFAVEFQAVTPSRIIELAAEPSSGVADGVTPVRLVATINPDLPPDAKVVAFTISQGGTISDNSVSAAGSNRAVTLLTASAARTYFATATVDGIRDDMAVTFAPALPERVHVAATNAVVASGDQTGITVTLLRDAGTPSTDLTVTYSARTAAGATIGSFSEIALSTGRNATATFNVGTSAYTGDIIITAVAQGGASGTVTIRKQ